MIYALTNISEFTEEDLHNSLPLLSAQRRKKVDGYLFIKDKILSASAFLLLRYALQKEFSLFEAPEFEIGEYGKPSLKKHSKIFFNLSHASSGIVCGISDSEIGVDIADRDSKNLDCARSALHINELQNLQKSRDPAYTFARYWSLKESFLKYSGIGIGNHIKDLDFAPYLSSDFVFQKKIMQVFDQRSCVITSCSSKKQQLHILSKSEIFSTSKEQIHEQTPLS